MKYLATIVSILAILFMTGLAIANDRQISTTVSKVTVSTDKNGNEYVRVIGTLDYELNGVNYQKSVPIMGFGAVASEMKNLKQGDSLNAIVSETNYKGRTSCSVITLLD